MKYPYVIGIDPGDVHVGYAILDRDESDTRVRMGVVHRPSRTFAALVNQLVDGAEGGMIVCESFQSRPVGHQRFDGGMTSQLIGALRYLTEERGINFMTVPPGKIEELHELYLDRYIEKWMPHRAQRWNHALSAWRVVGQFLLRHDPGYLELLRKQSVLKSLMIVGKPRQGLQPEDLFSGGASWRHNP